MEEIIRVFVADDHQIVRTGMLSLIAENPRFQVCGQASHGKEVLSIIAQMEHKPEVVLMDINMPVMDGIQCTEQLFKHYQGEVKVLALTMVKQGVYIRKMLQAGASGYLLKNCDKLELYEAIEAVQEGGTHFSPSVSMEVMNELMKIRRKTDKSVQARISKREREVLKLIIQDFSNKEIADKLHISVRTVESHKQNMISKTGTKHIAGLVVYAIRHNLVDIS